jgi:hypothetical protein
MFTTISESVAAYDDLLNEDGPVTIAGLTYDTAHALDSVDPIAYKCGWLDFMDALGVNIDDLEDDYTFSRDRL